MNCLLRPTRVVRLATWSRGLRVLVAGIGAATLLGASGVRAQTPLANQPPFSTTVVPGNLALPLSVEFPTAVSVANIAGYTTARPFLGYFDPGKCYAYNYDAANEANRYFYPSATTTTNACTGGWSGSFLNWATMQTIDPFRKVLTGGLRVTDTPTVTIIEKAWASGQGGTGNFPDRTLNAGVNGATPFGWAEFRMRIQGLGNRMRFSGTGDVNAAPTAYDPGAVIDPATTYEVSVRVRVCNPAAPGGVEGNCVQYGNNYKPQGLIQEYSDRIRYSAFGYLNDDNILRDGGVLRARQKFVGPTVPRPGLPSIPNVVGPLNSTGTYREWDPATGVFEMNPDPDDAAATGVTNSGVINYLNKFGQSGSYKTFDPVGELYYAAVRYFKNLGNVSEWSQVASAANAAQRNRWIDGFPVITNWDDPIQYSCQRNFILGIGDVNTHADKNVPGSNFTANEPTQPTFNDPTNAVADTDRIGAMEGLGTLGTTPYPFCCNNNAAFMAGLAYDAHTRDIRPDDAAVPRTLGMQTITTYWLDVLEYQNYRSRNQYWLAAKYGGFRVPGGYNPDTATAALAQATWNTGGQTVTGGTDLKPDNYFTATAPEEVEAGLRTAFASIAANLRATTTSFSTALPQVANAGTASFSAQYNAQNWTGEIEAVSLSFPPPNYTPTQTSQWRASERMAIQFAGAGWDTGRRVVTWNGTQGVAFRSSGASSVSAAQLATLDTGYVAGNDGVQFLNYLRGDRSNEIGQTGALGYRARDSLLGDIVNSRLTVVAGPPLAYSDAFNPGYGAFRAGNASRMRMVYAGSNDGILHAFNGDLGATGGTEVFAYVPSVLFSGPNNTPNVDGLAALGNPNFIHHYYVDGSPQVFDIDLGRTGGPIVGSPAPNWRSVLIGGLGKGGRSYFAIDVTDPASMTTEAAVAARVLWEFPNANTPPADRALFGYSYGQPKITKTAKWGWVVVFASGYNNSDGGGHLFFVNPSNGRLLERVDTGVGTAAAPAGLAHVQAYTRNFTDNTAETLYAGDLLGNVWRVDVRGTGTYQSATNPQLIARATTAGGAAQPITSRLRVAIHPRTGRRHVMFGTGRLLDATDLGDGQAQTFYAIEDGTLGSFNTEVPNTLPAGVTFPITRANLVENVDLLTGFTADPARPMGWYVELGVNASSLGWRTILEADVFYGEVAFASVVPGGDACSPSGNTRAYSVDFSTGRSTLIQTINVNGTPTVSALAYSTVIAGIVTDLRFVNREGTSELIGGGSGGGVSGLSRDRGTTSVLRRLNWRELPAPQ